MALNEEDLRGLSENEKAALREAGDDDEDVARELGRGADGTTAAAPAAPAGEAGEDEEAEEAARAAAAAAAAAPGAAPAAPPAQDGAAADEPDDDADYAPRVRSAPADIEDQRKALNQREDESMQKLLDGEITQEEHAKVRGEVRGKLDELLRLEVADSAVEAVERNAMVADYRRDLRATLKLGKEAGLDYTDEKLGPQFDRALKMFSENLSADGINDRPGNLANSRQALAEAHAFMMRRAGKTAPPPAPAPASTPAPAPAADKPRGARPPVDRSKLAPTLAAVPAAADASIANEFAHLEGLSPADTERALARMTPEQQERYLDA